MKRDVSKVLGGGCWGDGMGSLSPSLRSYLDFKLNECCRQRINFKYHRHKLHGKVTGGRGWDYVLAT